MLAKLTINMVHNPSYKEYLKEVNIQGIVTDIKSDCHFSVDDGTGCIEVRSSHSDIVKQKGQLLNIVGSTNVQLIEEHKLEYHVELWLEFDLSYDPNLESLWVLEIMKHWMARSPQFKSQIAMK